MRPAITVVCPRCRTEFETSYRPSINLDLEDWSDDEIEEATTATCPSCGTRTLLATLVVEGDTWTVTVG